ncbi:MAG: DUF2142 domain-containing protein [Acidocella sp.]|nr:DUF2142 domain-containing protein [Acidocella sp.]
MGSGRAEVGPPRFRRAAPDLARRIMMMMFVLCALPVGLLTALVTPAGQSPDEPNHLARAAGLLHGAVLAVRRPGGQTGVMVDTGLYVASFAPVTMIGVHHVVTASGFLEDRAQLPDHKLIFVDLPNTAAYFPAPYLPATLGLALGLLVKAPPFACFLLARLGMLAAFLALGVAALWVAAYGEALLLTVLLMPMTLFLAGTVNEDGVLIGMVCLACAALTRGAQGWRVLALVLFGLFLGSKAPYIPLLAVFLLPLAGGRFRARLRDVLVTGTAVTLWVALITVFVIVPFGQPLHHPGPLYTGDPWIWLHQTDAAANLHILLARPIRFLALPVFTEAIWGVQILREAVGVLGALEIQLPNGYYAAWAVCGGAALVGLVFVRRPVAARPRVAAGSALVVGFLLLFTYWLLFIVFYLDWTEVGNLVIDGVQGRYILPMLPFLLFAVPGWQGRLALPKLWPALPTLMMGLFDIGYVPVKLVWTFYLH